MIVVSFEEWMFSDLLELVEDAHEQSPVMRLFEYDDKRVQNLLGYAVFTPERVLGVACMEMAGREREITGFLIAAPTPLPYAAQFIGTDLLAYIAPAHRDGNVLELLTAAYARWAKRIGLKVISLELTPLLTTESLEYTDPEWERVGSRVIRRL